MKKNNILVSIIVPVYNASTYLDNFIKSAINQTYKNIEIILVNDGSKDNSLEICNKYKNEDNRIIVIDKKNTGVSDTRNEGIKKSKGFYVTFSDADDILELDAIENMVNIALKYDVDVVRTNFSVNNTVTNLSDDLLGIKKDEELKDVLNNVVNSRIKTYVWLLLIKRSILIDNDITFDTNLSMMEDTVFYIELLSVINSIYFTNKKTYNYIVHLTSLSRDNKRVYKNIDSILNVRDVLSKVLEHNLYNRLCMNAYIIICNYMVENIRYDEYDNVKNIFNYLIESKSFNKLIKLINKNDLKHEYLIMYDSFIKNDYSYLESNFKKIKKRLKFTKVTETIKGKLNLSKHYNNLKYKKKKIMNSIKGNH